MKFPDAQNLCAGRGFLKNKEMEVTELRIGNLISGKEFNCPVSEYKINWIGQESVGLDAGKYKIGIRLEYLSGIPLTEEWLVKLGFRYSAPDWMLDDLGIRKMGNGFVYLNGIDGGLIYEFVHQLQNLYFALTGRELKIN